MLLADHEIESLCTYQVDVDSNMIQPFINCQIRNINDRRVISYGLSSYGYDIRLSPKEFKVYQHVPGSIVSPKHADDRHFWDSKLHHAGDGDYFIIPGHTYSLGVSLERFNIPHFITGICMGKSTYARVGLIVNVTPLEAGWRGYLTIEISNSSDADVKVYANEGIAQILFMMGHQECETTYNDRNGKYQSQEHQITMPRL